MKIRIEQEKDGRYFARVMGQEGVHAVGDTPDQAMEYLIDVYEQASSLRAEKIHEQFFVNRSLVDEPLLRTSFKSLTLTI